MKQLLLVTLMTLAIVFSTADQCLLPLYYEYINDFALASNHLQNLINSNFSKIALDNFNAANGAHIYDIQGVFQYDQSQKSVSGEGLQIFVIEGFKLNIQMKANVTKLVVQKERFNITAELSPMTLTYNKEIKQGQLYPKVSNVNFKFNISSLKFSYEPKPSDKDQKKLLQALQGNSGKTLASQLEAYLKKINFDSLISPQCQKEPISKIFKNGIYKYKNGNDVIDFDMKFNQLKYFANGKVLRNGINGSDLGIIGHDQQDCFQNQTFDQLPEYHTFISKQFINNMVKSASKTYSQFNSVEINRNNMKSVKTLKFKLTDLKNIIPSALQKYQKYSDNQIGFSCRVAQLGELKTIVYRDLKWYCGGYLLDENSIRIPLTYFQVMIRHSIDIGLSVRYLTVQTSELSILNEDLTFYEVDEMQVINIQEAKNLILDAFEDMKVYTVGTYFDIVTDSNQLLYGDDGLWIKKSQQQKYSHNLVFEE